MMDTPLTIRPINGETEIAQCAAMMSQSEPWITLGRDYAAGVALLSRADREIYVAVAGTDVAGFVILNMQGAFVGYLQTICVAPEWRNQGVGRQLINFSEARIFRECQNVFLCVSSFNADARRLYERLGYQVVGELTDYLVTGYSEILMRKTLGALVDLPKRLESSSSTAR